MAAAVSSMAQNATVTIRNKSDYSLTVKVMQADGPKVAQLSIFPGGARAVSFASSGKFFCKTKAQKGIEKIYRKSDPFEVICDKRGYTEGTLEFFVSPGEGGDGQSISASEFEDDGEEKAPERKKKAPVKK